VSTPRPQESPAARGLAAERTALAWHRTALAGCGLAVISAVDAVRHGAPVGWVGLGGVVVVTGLALLAAVPGESRGLRIVVVAGLVVTLGGVGVLLAGL